MKLKKVKKILPPWETIRVWGDDDYIYLFHGLVEDLPKDLYERELVKGPEDGYLEVRYNCGDIENHIAVFVKEK
jgi:hypothetical protein